MRPRDPRVKKCSPWRRSALETDRLYFRLIIEWNDHRSSRVEPHLSVSVSVGHGGFIFLPKLLEVEIWIIPRRKNV